jgi:two-component system, NtrC family, nitrogen regulation sensor histidine kinase NtrY
MILKRYEWRLVIRIALLFAVMLPAAWLVVKALYMYAAICIPFLFYLLYDLYKLLKNAQDEVKEFAESVHYRDFSRYFNVKHAPAELQPLREGFNEINSTFKHISRKKKHNMCTCRKYWSLWTQVYFRMIQMKVRLRG